jgi:hypothetical protein
MRPGPELVARFLPRDEENRRAAHGSLAPFDADQEEAEPIRLPDRVLPVEDQGQAARDRDAGQARTRGLDDCPGADGRQVDPEVLPALRRLHQDAAVIDRPEQAAAILSGGPSECRVRALRPLDRDHALSPDDGRLADIER